MFIRKRWNELIRGEDCPLCNPPAENAILLRMASGTVILQNDANFRGYCILVHQRHVTELTELSPAERQQWVEDVASLTNAVLSVCKPDKINYAILGNEVPHFHCHVIPRYADDGWWGRPIWLRPSEELVQMDESEYSTLRAELQNALTRTFQE